MPTRGEGFQKSKNLGNVICKRFLTSLTVKVANVVCENLVCDMCFGKFEHLQVGPVGFSYGI